MKRWVRILLPMMLAVAPVLGQVLYISRFAVNVPFWDQWVFPPLLRVLSSPKMEQLWVALWNQNNEHRILFPKLVFLTLARISAWNVIAEMYVSWLLAGLTLVGLGLIYRKSCRGPLWGFVPLAWLVFSLGQYENILWGWQLQIYLQVAATTFGIYLLSHKSVQSVVWAALCGIVASFSFNSGLLIWPVGLVCLVALRAEKKQLALWSLVGTLAVVAYYWGYVSPSYLPSPIWAFSHPITTVQFFLINVGAPLGGGNVEMSGIMGTYLIVLLCFFLYRELRMLARRGFQIPGSDVTLGSLVLLSLLTSLAITFGRGGFETFDYAIHSRYTTITSMTIAGLWMLFVKSSLPDGTSNESSLERANSSLLSALLSTLVIGLALSNLYGIRMGEAQHAGKLKMKYALQTFETQPDGTLAGLFISPQIIREGAKFLKENRLSVFHEPVNMLLPTSSKGMPVGEILPDRPVVQSLKCPVQTLNDVEIRFATYARKNTSQVEITLTDGAKPLAQRSLSSVQIKDNSWVPVVLPSPIRDCKGSDLVLKISSQDASPGNAVTIWTYPRYYEGDLVEPKDESLADRVIGLELNGVFYGLAQ